MSQQPDTYSKSWELKLKLLNEDRLPKISGIGAVSIGAILHVMKNNPILSYSVDDACNEFVRRMKAYNRCNGSRARYNNVVDWLKKE